MLRFQETACGPQGISRRDILRVGGLSAAGLTLAHLVILGGARLTQMSFRQ